MFRRARAWAVRQWELERIAREERAKKERARMPSWLEREQRDRENFQLLIALAVIVFVAGGVIGLLVIGWRALMN